MRISLRPRQMTLPFSLAVCLSGGTCLADNPTWFDTNANALVDRQSEYISEPYSSFSLNNGGFEMSYGPYEGFTALLKFENEDELNGQGYLWGFNFRYPLFIGGRHMQRSIGPFTLEGLLKVGYEDFEVSPREVWLDTNLRLRLFSDTLSLRLGTTMYCSNPLKSYRSFDQVVTVGIGKAW